MKGINKRQSRLMDAPSYEDHRDHQHRARRHAGGVPANPSGLGAYQSAIERAQGGRNSEDRKVDAIADVDPRKPHERPHQEPVVQPIEPPALRPPPDEEPSGQRPGEPDDEAPFPKEKAAGDGDA